MHSIQVSITHIILLAMTVIGLKSHVTIIPAILNASARDGWLSVLFSSALMLPWLFIVLYIHKASSPMGIKQWLTQAIGQVATRIILASVVLCCLVLAAVTMRETLLWVGTTFLPKTPMLILLVVYVLLIVFLISSNMAAMTIINTIVLAGVIVLGFFVAIINSQVKNYALLQPVLEHGVTPVVYGAIFPTAGFFELLLLLFLQHHMKGSFKWWHLALILLILTTLTLGPLIGAITEFGPVEAAKQHYPAYEEWGLVKIGNYIEHLDFFSVYQWLTGTFIRVGLLLYIVVDLCAFQEQKKKIWSYIVPPFLLICFGLSLVQDDLFLRLNESAVLIVTVGYLGGLSMLLFIIALFTKSRMRKAGAAQHE